MTDHRPLTDYLGRSRSSASRSSTAQGHAPSPFEIHQASWCGAGVELTDQMRHALVEESHPAQRTRELLALPAEQRPQLL